jgi:hypothetical protein
MADDAPYGRTITGIPRSEDQYLRLNRARGIMSGQLRVDPETGQAEQGPARDLGRALRGYKKGGKVKATGKAKVHKGEYVLKKSAADRIGSRSLNRMNRGQSDKRLLQRTPFRR